MRLLGTLATLALAACAAAPVKHQYMTEQQTFESVQRCLDRQMDAMVWRDYEMRVLAVACVLRG